MSDYKAGHPLKGPEAVKKSHLVGGHSKIQSNTVHYVSQGTFYPRGLKPESH